MNNKIMLFMAALVCLPLACNASDKYIFSPQSENLRLIILGHNNIKPSEIEKKPRAILVAVEQRIMFGLPRAKPKSGHSKKKNLYI